MSDSTVRLGTDTSWAIFSPCMKYRYALGREFESGGIVSHPDDLVGFVRTVLEPRLLVWLMLNPSTADHEQLDPTLKRCAFFSRAYGYAGFLVLNLYAFKATEPTDMPMLDRKPSTRAIGPANDAMIREWTAGRDVVVGWGNHGTTQRVREVSELLSDAARVDCLAINDDGSPRHPLARGRLRIPDTAQRQPWRLAA